MLGAVSAFDADRFARLRRERATSWGSPLHCFASTASTNDEALRAARAGAPEGSLFVADHQSRGRGRRGRSWRSEPGEGLLFSLLLRPAEHAPGPSLTLAAGLAVRAAVAARVPLAAQLKWPNDVLVGGRKLAGILCEALSGLSAVVVGVGLNVTGQPLQGPLALSPTCLEALGARGEQLAREPLLADITAELERRLHAFFSRGLTSLREEFHAHDALRGRRVIVDSEPPLIGQARGIDEQGRLIVLSEGAACAVGAGTVREIDEAEPPPPLR